MTTLPPDTVFATPELEAEARRTGAYRGTPPNRIVAGQLLFHIPTSTPFRVLCNCPSSSPAHHVLRNVQAAPANYRPLTLDETTAFLNAARTPATRTPTAYPNATYAAAVQRAATTLQPEAPGVTLAPNATPSPSEDSGHAP